MDISRRDLFRSAGVVGTAAALGGLGSLSADAVAGARTLARNPHATRGKILAKGPAAPGGWRPVVRADGEPYQVRTNLGIDAKHGRAKRRKPLIAFAQLSDVHVCDAQSPMRLEYGEQTSSSAYRPQEILGAHVANAMVKEINRIGRGPVTGKPFALAIQTGDNSDNSQYNELRWNIDVLDGEEVRADSGDLTRYEGVMDSNPAFYDRTYWHPEGTPVGLEDDRPRSEFGFPTVPGLLDAARAPFQAEGLSMPWYSALGNHDGLVQGNWNRQSTSPDYQAIAVGTTKKVLANGQLTTRQVTADPNRRLLSRAEWVEEHFTTTGTPEGHGFTGTNRTDGTAYYHFDRGAVRFVVLDTVNANGFDTGSLDKAQFTWLQALLAATRNRLVILASHHPLQTMTNSFVGNVDPQPRVLADAITKELLKHELVVAWVNGHTHSNNVWAHKRSGGGGFWEINTASHIDWPQQARLLEVTDNKDGTVSIFATMLDHGSPLEFDGNLDDPSQLAGLSRLLAANDWQEQDNNRRGRLVDRNVELIVRAPKFLR
jgi:metallophosphoesterase (TIGR03767 family)